MLIGDLNSKTGTADDDLSNDGSDGSNNFVNIPIDGPKIEIDDIISNSKVNILK